MRVAMHDGEIAAVVEAVRTGAHVEAGVATTERYRRGFTTAATAGWASHPTLHGTTRFYSTDQTNIAASQGVARRLGLHFIGANLRIS